MLDVLMGFAEYADVPLHGSVRPELIVPNSEQKVSKSSDLTPLAVKKR
jgi:hypothetical protein